MQNLHKFSLVIVMMLLSGCGPLLLVNQGRQQGHHSVYIVNSPVFSLDSNFKKEFSAKGYLVANSPKKADYIIYLVSTPGGICYRIAGPGHGVTTCNCVYFVSGDSRQLARMAAHDILFDLANFNSVPVSLKNHSEVQI